MTTAGQLAYEAYGKSTGGKTYDGRDMPTWAVLPIRIREAWTMAAVAGCCIHGPGLCVAGELVAASALEMK